ncbi:MAG TPA: hypothetical protein VLH15_06860 [Dehalococcoidales bacterium]|nr:hypothetical protein [Dehalococcoidales bacterium]
MQAAVGSEPGSLGAVEINVEQEGGLKYMGQYDKYWKLLSLENFDTISFEDVTKCAKVLAQLVPQAYRAGKMVSDLGEVWACTILQMKRMPRGHTGYDAIDEKGIVDEKRLKYQIKTRSPQTGDKVNEAGTVGQFTNLGFDAALLVLLDSSLQPYELCVVERQVLEGQLRPGRNDITIAKFLALGTSLPR